MKVVDSSSGYSSPNCAGLLLQASPLKKFTDGPVVDQHTHFDNGEKKMFSTVIKHKKRK